MLQTVIETPEFIKQATSCMDETTRKTFIDFVARYPASGDLIPGTGGARKIRWYSHNHQGKRGGARIIYYYHDHTLPIFLFTAYAKTRKENLTMNEKNQLRKIIQLIVKSYQE
jgi:hypothetical protein